MKRDAPFLEALAVARKAVTEFKARQLADAHAGRDVLANGLLASAANDVVREIKALRRAERKATK